MTTLVWIIFRNRPTDGSMSSGFMISSSSLNWTAFFFFFTSTGPAPIKFEDVFALVALMSTSWAIRLLWAVWKSVKFLNRQKHNLTCRKEMKIFSIKTSIQLHQVRLRIRAKSRCSSYSGLVCPRLDRWSSRSHSNYYLLAK